VTYLRGFIPWIVFGVVSEFSWGWGTVAALLTGVFLLLLGRVRNIPFDAQVIEISTTIYFALMGVSALVVPQTLEPLRTYGYVLSFAWLGLTTWGSLAIGKPFCLGIARRQTPREVWDIPEFVQINNAITVVWSTAFTFLALSLGACVLFDLPTVCLIAFHAAGLAAPIAFTTWYPRHARRTIMAKYGATQDDAPQGMAQEAPGQTPEGLR